MSYSQRRLEDPTLKLFSLFVLYNSVKDFDDGVAPIQEKSISQFQLRRLACWHICFCSHLTSCCGDASIGVNI
jgi:hypothetical protein